MRNFVAAINLDAATLFCGYVHGGGSFQNLTGALHFSMHI